MIGLVLVMHEPLASAMLVCIKHVMGEVPEAIQVLDVPPDESVDVTVSHIQTLAREVHQGEGVVFLTDLFGATPSNASMKAGLACMDIATVLVAGANLPMVLRAISYRDLPISEMAERLVAGGRNGIVSTGTTAPQQQTFNPAETDDSARNQHQQ